MVQSNYPDITDLLNSFIFDILSGIAKENKVARRERDRVIVQLFETETWV